MSDEQALARHFMEAEGEQIVRDMAAHVGDQMFETLKRNGMMMRSVAGAVGALCIAAAHTLGQAHDFLRRSLADVSDGEPAIEAGPDEVAAMALLFLGELPPSLRLAISAPAWQPIEAAPTDGTVVDLLFAHGREIDCYFDNGWAAKRGYPAVWKRWFEEPTHWQPLAPPPVDAPPPATILGENDAAGL